ncbi:hAT family dimerization domain protein [Ilyonectria robusta]
MAPSTNVDNPALLLTTPSTANSDLNTATDINRFNVNREVTADTSSSADYTSYKGIDWNRLSGYCIRKHRRRQRTGWVWEHGFDIEKDGSGSRFWLCKECHRKKATLTHIYDTASTSQANSHMEDVHRINRGGLMPPRRKKQRTLFDMADLDAHRQKDQAVMNAFIASFDPLHFQRLLIRWVACDNVSFNKLESLYFHELMGYANSAIIESGSLPTHNTMRDWIC